MKIGKIQFIWWWRRPYFKVWAYPRDFVARAVFRGKPIFYGLYLGIVEIRYFPRREPIRKGIEWDG